jgi:hypothetical protein
VWTGAVIWKRDDSGASYLVSPNSSSVSAFSAPQHLQSVQSHGLYILLDHRSPATSFALPSWGVRSGHVSGSVVET